MFKIYRSTSEILHKNRPSDLPLSRQLPPEVEDRIRRKSKQIIKTQDSREMFGEARSVAQNSPTLKRNRSSSYSKQKIFSKAREVKGHETFHKTLITQNTMNSYLGASNFQFSQYKNDKSKGKMNEVAQRKLIISKVLSDMQQSKLRLTLRGQILKNQSEKQKELDLLQPKSKSKQDEHLLGYSESKFPSQLVYSKQFQPKDDPYRYNDSLSLTSTQANQQKLKQYSKQLAANIQESIKKEMQEHYLSKQRQLQEKYIEKEKLYLEKFKNLETVMETQLEKERKILIETINQQLEKQISKVSQNQLREQGKKQRVEENRSVKESPRVETTPRTVIQSKQEPKKQTKQRKPSQGKTAEVANIFNQSQTIQVQELVPAKKVETNDRKKSAHFEPSHLPPKRAQSNDPNPKLSKPIKAAAVQPPAQQKNNRKKSNYNDDSYLQQIQEISLEKKPQTNMVKRQIQKDRVNQSFNIDKKLNSSFSSQRPPANKGKNTEQQKPQRKFSEEEKAKQQQQQRKAYIRAKLKEQIQNDPILIAIGEVAGYCSKFCKKSKIDWRIPSLLLYRYCYDFFRSFKGLYQQAKELNLIKKEELDKYYEYDSVMGANLSKMYKAITKKITLSSAYISMIQSNEIELERLKPYAVMEAKRYVKDLTSSPESSRKSGDYVVVQCGLRVINSVFIIKKLNGVPTQLIEENIQGLGEAETFDLFDEWSSKLLQESSE